MSNYKRIFGRWASTLLSWGLAIGLVVAILLNGPGILIFHTKIPQAHASALSFICASSATATSTAACTGEQAGDLLLIMCGETSGGASPALPTGVTAITGSALTNSGGNSSSRTGMNVGYISAASSSSGSGSCGTGTTDTVMMVYRGWAASPIGTSVGTESGNNSSTSMIYNSASLTTSGGSSWWAAFAIRNTADTQVGTAPTGMTNRTKVPTATPAAAGHDLNGPTNSNWSAQTVSGFSASSKYTSIVLELKANPILTVGATGNAVASMTSSSNSNFTGGAFTFIREVGSANVVSITVTNIGTVSDSNISNLFLFFKTEAACETSFPSSGTTQFNSTGGTFSGGVSTVSGSITVGTSNICLYAKIDIGSANNGDTLDLEIADPNTDVGLSIGTASPATAVSPTGSTTISAGPTTDQLLRGGEFFSGGSKQPYYWAQ